MLTDWPLLPDPAHVGASPRECPPPSVLTPFVARLLVGVGQLASCAAVFSMNCRLPRFGFLARCR